MKRQVNVRVSDATRAKLDWLAATQYGTQAEAVAVAIDRMYRKERSTMSTSPDRVTVTAARMIRPFEGPQWLIEVHPNAEESDADDLEAVNAAEIEVLSTELRGWGEYNAVIRVTANGVEADYLARLA